MNVLAKAKWKSVPMDPELKAKGFSEGLLGIEELKDYKLMKVNKKKISSVVDGKVTVGDKNLKRTLEQTIKNSEQESTKKKKKRKKKSKPKTDKPNEKKLNHERILCDDDEQDNSVELEGWKEFSIPQPVLRALKDLKYNEPTPIQRETLPAAINGHADVVGAAETGSGKTLAFGIPMVHGILSDRICDLQNDSVNADTDASLDEHDDAVSSTSEMSEEDMENLDATSGCVRVVNDVEFDFDIDMEMPSSVIETKNKRKIKNGPLRALVLTPTRELAIQVRNHIQAICKYTDIKTVAIVGGMAPQKQIRLLDQAPEIVVATPGRFWDLIQEGHPHLSKVVAIRYLAIDETDRMIEKGHFEELQSFLELLNQDENKNKKRQTFVFSATLSLVHEMPKHLAQKKGKKNLTPEEKMQQVMEMIGVKSRPKIVDLTRKFGTAETLTESRIHCSTVQKDLYLYYFLQQHPGRTIVFCNSIDCVRRLVNLFGLLSTEPLGLHAQMHQKQRLKNLERFTINVNGFLIATDVAARGLDIPDVEHVVHYQVPRTSESYVHRSGRTARAKKDGLSVVFIDPSENQYYKRMCRTLNRDEDLPAFPIDDSVLTAVKIRVNTARELDKLLLANKKEEVEKNWFKKAAEEAELDISDSDSENEFEHTKSRQKATKKAKIAAKKAELTTMLATPIHTQYYVGKYPTMSGKLLLPTDFKTKGHDDQSALKAMSNSKAEIKALLKSRSSLASNWKKKRGKKKKSGQKH